MTEVVSVKQSEFKQKWGLVLEGVANDLRNELVHTCPVDTGFLKNSIRISRTGGIYDIIMSKYGLYVEYGTAPHIIKPKNKKALHWGGKDGPFANIVHHPGTRPQPFIRSTINTKLKSILVNNIKRHLL